MVIDEQNRSPRRISIARAVREGVAFAVTPSQSIIALDLDEPADWTWADLVCQSLPRGFRFVRTESGREGHGHVWVIAPPGWNHESITRIIDGVEPLRGRCQTRTAPTRPPYAPHRWAGVGRSTIIEPSAEEALAWFRATRRRELRPEVLKCLHSADEAVLKERFGKPNASATLHSIAMAAINCRWTFEDFRRAVDSSRGIAVKELRMLDPDRRPGKLEKIWLRAGEYIRRNPPVPYPELARAKNMALRSAMTVVPWSTRGGASERAVYLALLALADVPGVTTVGASLRQIAIYAGVSKETVARTLKRLASLGLVAKHTTVSQASADRYELLDYREMYPPDDNPSVTPIGGGPNEETVLTSVHLDDIFANGAGLGLSCRETWNAMSEEWQATAEIAARSGKTAGTVRKHCKRLGAVGLAERLGHRVRRLVPSEAEIARTAIGMGVSGLRGRRDARLVLEQQGFRDFYRDQDWLHPGLPERGSGADDAARTLPRGPVSRTRGDTPGANPLLE